VTREADSISGWLVDEQWWQRTANAAKLLNGNHFKESDKLGGSKITYSVTVLFSLYIEILEYTYTGQ